MHIVGLFAIRFVAVAVVVVVRKPPPSRALAFRMCLVLQEAFLGLILLTVTGMSAMTEGLGLSNTLGAFLAGVLLSETKYRYQV